MGGGGAGLHLLGTNLQSARVKLGWYVVGSDMLYLFEVVKGWQDDLVTSSDETDGGQQLEDQGFCPGRTGDTRSHNVPG